MGSKLITLRIFGWFIKVDVVYFLNFTCTPESDVNEESSSMIGSAPNLIGGD